jgi:hypothetical protein
MTPLPSREETALRVLAGRESAEQAAARLGVPADEIRRWCALVQLGSDLGQTPARGAWRTAAFGGLALLLVASTWARVAMGAPCNNPAGWPSTGMSALCPDTPALAGPINANFSYLSDAIKKKFSPSTGLNASPGGWVGSTNIKAKQLTSTHLTTDLFSSIHLGNGSISGADFASASIQQDKLKQTKFYARNAACKTSPGYLLTSTCVSSKTTDLCPPGLSMYYVCSTASGKTPCQSAPPAPCANTLLGGYVSP